MGRMDNKVALVTGAARGMGAATARLFAAEGARVVLTDLRDELGHEVAEDIGDAAHFIHQDIADEASWATVLTEVTETFGGLDVLVNNAGILRRVPLAEETVEEYRKVLEVNVIGVFLGIRTAAPLLTARGGGSIVNLASNAGAMGVPGYAAYASSKWAVRGLSRSAALELAGQGIRVNAVLPGLIDTPMNAALNLQPGAGKTSHIPLGRVGEAEDIARAVLFLASDESSFVSGAEITVDGGSIAGPTHTP